ncbi:MULTISPECIES: DUF535 family protein [unclassified Duganella]|uniref:DUF535 family protein n=1 Tax=unclassified Duganella TaxID=2636909 RepID=UPI000E35570F|nr:MULTISPECIES: DUF535 family protein [unclassified Duganella]RFP18849.1 DUF535 domain-containing protein [Duganella sp. BJB475]RFP35513.1 DUF535 domain-containing protein [Duganella sp. BJB476]
MKQIGLPKNSVCDAFNRVIFLLINRFIPLIQHLRGHFSWLRTLSHPNISSLATLHPRLKYKYLRNNYLFFALPIADALKIMRYHYQVISKYVGVDFFSCLFEKAPLIWELQKDECHFGIRMTYPRDLRRESVMHDHEGDLALLFEADGVPIYVLCMTIVPNYIAERNFHTQQTSDVIFIGRVQGVNGQFSAVRAATKSLYDTTPARLLVNATEAIARLLSIQLVVGVSNEKQLSREKTNDEKGAFFDYDTFWTSIGSCKTDNGFFSMRPESNEKPIEEVQQKHRSRTLAKRKFRKSVVDVTELGLRRIFTQIEGLNTTN